MTGRPPTCICGECKKCKHRIVARASWQSKSLEEKREIIARRDPEKVKAADRARYYRHRTSRLALMSEYQRRNREKINALSAESAARYPEKKRCRSLTRTLILTGVLKKQPCEVCGREDVHAHHDDYSKPAEVRWLCPTHHAEIHRRYAA